MLMILGFQMNFLGSILNFFLFFSLTGNVICSLNRKESLMSEYFKLTGRKSNAKDPKSPLELKLIDYTDFIASFYKKYPLKSLEEAYSMRDYAFDEIFFDSICNQYRFYSREIPKPDRRFEKASITIENIQTIVHNNLFEPFTSINDIEEKISIFGMLIRFIERYLNLSDAKQFTGINHKELFNRVCEWKFIMESLSSCYSNGKFDYNYFSSSFHWIIGKENFVLPYYNQNNNRYYLLITAYVNHIIKLKEIEFYEMTHPDFPFLVSFILSHIDEYGNSIFRKYDPIIGYGNLYRFFASESMSKEQPSAILKAKSKIVAMARNRLWPKNPKSESISGLIDLWKKFIPEPRSEKNHNIWWQLNGLAILEDSLKTSKFRVHEHLHTK
jgi:hypothetical protein